MIADFNGDGHLDIAFGTGAAQVAIIFGDGHGGFSAHRLIPVANDGTGADELILLDANKDGKPDLILNTAKVTGDVLHETFLLLNDGTANFSVTVLSRAGFSGDIAGFVTAVADFDNDGFPDFLFAQGMERRLGARHARFSRDGVKPSPANFWALMKKFCRDTPTLKLL